MKSSEQCGCKIRRERETSKNGRITAKGNYHQSKTISPKMARAIIRILIRSENRNQNVRPINANTFQMNQKGNQIGDVRSFTVLMM